MKKQLTIINSTRLVFLFFLLFSFSCSEDVDEIEENSQLSTYQYSDLPHPKKAPNRNDELSARLQGSRTTQACDNPQGYREYTANEVLPRNTTDVNGVRPILDDRTCAYNYQQTNIGGVTYGTYKLRSGTNPYDTKQPRIERASTAANSNAPGTKVTFTGTVVINRVGDAQPNDTKELRLNTSGTYICQAKGRDTRTQSINNNFDPALALLLVKPVSGSGANQTRFRFYVEHMKNDAGALRDNFARTIENLNFDINKGEPIAVTMTNEFLGTCNNLIHRVTINLRGNDRNGNPRNLTRTYDIPEPTRGTQAKIRFGAYRCWNGEADINWASGVNMTSVTGSGSCSGTSSNESDMWNPEDNIIKVHRFPETWASSSWSNSYLAPKGTDSSRGTRWASGNFSGGHWLATRSNYWHTIKRAKVSFDAAISRDFDIIYYDGSSWKTAAQITNNTKKDVKIEGLNHRGYMFAVYSKSSPYNHISIYEFELYDTN